MLKGKHSHWTREGAKMTFHRFHMDGSWENSPPVVFPSKNAAKRFSRAEQKAHGGLGAGYVAVLSR